MDKIEFRKIGSVRLHPDNVAIFGLPQDEPNYEEIREDIRKRGLQEPLIILSDGTILSGHLRFVSVCWSMEQEGLTQDQIREQVIAVRVHEDFDSKEEELVYLMAANEKRRQFDPRRIANSWENLIQRIEASLEVKKGVKRSEALQGLADRLGTSHKLAKSYCTIFGSKIVPEEVKEKVNSKSLAPSAVLEAIKFAEDSAKRESRAPSMADVDAYIKHPKSKSTLADAVRQVAKGTSVTTSTGAPSPTPKPEAKTTIVEVAPEPPKVAAQAPEEPKQPEPPKAEPTPAMDPSWGSHIGHCCYEHGCKYGDDACPVAAGKVEQEGPCETCGLISEGYFDKEVLDEDKIPYARRLLKQSLGRVVLDDNLKSELLGLHTELTSYLLAMDIIKPSVEFSLPTTTLAQLELCTSLVQGIGDNVQDPQATRDALLDLVSFAKIPIERLGTAKRGFEPNGLYCPECLGKQYITPIGVSCEMGHSGLEGITDSQATAIRLSQSLTEEKAKCSICGSQVETARDANHASCPKCGLVDTADIEPVEEESIAPSQPPTNDASLLTDEDLSAILEAEVTPEPPKPEKAPEPPKPEKAPEPPPEPKKVVKAEKPPEPKKASAPVQAKPSATEDQEAAFVSEVISDFLGEIQKAGVDPSAPMASA